MSRTIPERDWKKFRIIYPIALDRFSEQILEEVDEINSNEDLSYHERYLKIYKLIKNRDREMANIFNDFRRSTALLQLGQMNAHGLLRSEEIEEFSEETQEVLNFLRGDLS